jgi:hypothetical protein
MRSYTGVTFDRTHRELLVRKVAYTSNDITSSTEQIDFTLVTDAGNSCIPNYTE